MKRVTKTLSWTFALLILFSGLCIGAVQTVDMTYLESDLGLGLWQYDFTISNVSCPIDESMENIFDVFLDFGVLSGLTSITNVSLPEGWAYFANPGNGIDLLAFVETYSLNFGPPPAGTDIAPGTALGGFVFEFDEKLNAIHFEALLGKFDPDGNLIGEIYTANGTATPVPLPATIFLLASGMAGLAVFGRKKFYKIE